MSRLSTMFTLSQHNIVQELCESRGGRPGLSEPSGFRGFIEPCFGIGHNLSLICQLTSEDIKHQLIKRHRLPDMEEKGL